MDTYNQIFLVYLLDAFNKNYADFSLKKYLSSFCSLREIYFSNTY